MEAGRRRQKRPIVAYGQITRRHAAFAACSTKKWDYLLAAQAIVPSYVIVCLFPQ